MAPRDVKPEGRTRTFEYSIRRDDGTGWSEIGRVRDHATAQDIRRDSLERHPRWPCDVLIREVHTRYTDWREIA